MEQAGFFSLFLQAVAMVHRIRLTLSCPLVRVGDLKSKWRPGLLETARATL